MISKTILKWEEPRIFADYRKELQKAYYPAWMQLWPHLIFVLFFILLFAVIGGIRFWETGEFSKIFFIWPTLFGAVVILSVYTDYLFRANEIVIREDGILYRIGRIQEYLLYNDIKTYHFDKWQHGLDIIDVLILKKKDDENLMIGLPEHIRKKEILKIFEGSGLICDQI